MNKKIAVITDDGKTISRHFGRALHYLVIDIQDGQMIGRELRPKPGHHTFGNQAQPEGQHQHEHHGAGHGFDDASHQKHAGMAGVIADCEAVLCGGMGMGAYESMRRLNIRPVVTDLNYINEAVQAYLDGTLIDHQELLH
ncbi:MAG: NifB/NifX family molybdenum-iron cluster-binding protein [Anaerolineaceae bacterium]